MWAYSKLIRRLIKLSHISNKNIKMSSLKSSENIQKKEGGPLFSHNRDMNVLCMSDPTWKSQNHQNSISYAQ